LIAILVYITNVGIDILLAQAWAQLKLVGHAVMQKVEIHSDSDYASIVVMGVSSWVVPAYH
jgi:hypothetical protein